MLCGVGRRAGDVSSTVRSASSSRHGGRRALGTDGLTLLLVIDSGGRQLMALTSVHLQDLSEDEPRAQGDEAVSGELAWSSGEEGASSSLCLEVGSPGTVGAVMVTLRSFRFGHDERILWRQVRQRAGGDDRRKTAGEGIEC